MYTDTLPTHLCVQLRAVHGLAATNPFLYAVYTRIAELDLRSVGLTTTWHALQPKIREEEWQGVKQRYWQLDEYWLPLCRFEDFS